MATSYCFLKTDGEVVLFPMLCLACRENTWRAHFHTTMSTGSPPNEHSSLVAVLATSSQFHLETFLNGHQSAPTHGTPNWILIWPLGCHRRRHQTLRMTMIHSLVIHQHSVGLLLVELVQRIRAGKSILFLLYQPLAQFQYYDMHPPPPPTTGSFAIPGHGIARSADRC